MPSTPVLNVKHLIYIATRPGVMRNPECSFGLWGRLPDQNTVQMIDDLEAAKKAVFQASKGHTLWRVILSVDESTAQNHGLYDRKTWEILVNGKISVLAKEMDIKPSDLCWTASMHHAKGHPHVHILYWDKSDAIHPEAMSESRFEIFSEKVRAEFNREIFREELHETQEEKKIVDQELRLTLRSLLTQANVAETMDIKNIPNQKLDQLSRTFFDLVSQLPAKGAWKYAYLSEETKERLNDFFDTLRAELPDFERQYQKYLMLARQISTLYGNGEHAQAHHQEQARETMYRNLGNEFLKIAREYRNELQENVRPNTDQLHRTLYQGIRLILSENKKYRDLLSQMPKFRTPMRVLWRDEKRKTAKDDLVQELSNDIRVRIQMRGFLTAMGEDLSEEDKAALWKTEYRTLYQTIDHIVSDALREDAGYNQQARVDAMADALLRLFHSSSQGAGQLQCHRDLLRLRKKELSKTAQRDRAAKLDHSGDWTPEW